MDMSPDMQHQVMGYDRTATMFSPEGHLLQVEYAEKTVRLGSASIGMCCANGAVIVADKRMSDKLLTGDSINKIVEVDNHIMAVSAGILSDARILIEKAQLAAQQHRIVYDSPIEPELIIKEIANTKQMFTQYGGARPFGVSIMLAGLNKQKPELYVSDVTGNYFKYKTTAIGENDERIKEKLREHYSESLDIKQGIKLALKIFKEIQGKNFNLDRFEIVYVEKANPRINRLRDGEVKKFIK